MADAAGSGSSVYRKAIISLLFRERKKYLNAHFKRKLGVIFSRCVTYETERGRGKSYWSFFSAPWRYIERRLWNALKSAHKEVFSVCHSLRNHLCPNFWEISWDYTAKCNDNRECHVRFFISNLALYDIHKTPWRNKESGILLKYVFIGFEIYPVFYANFIVTFTWIPPL